MHRELTVERRGDLFHLRFHDYLGPWEGHRIEEFLDLEEVALDPGDDEGAGLGPNQCRLLHAMDFGPELVALVTEDRLSRVAQIVRDRRVEVLAGDDLLPEPPPEHVVFDKEAEAVEDGYVARIEERHRPPWARGPRAFAGALLLRVVPLALVVFVGVVIARHTGDRHESVGLAEMFTRAGETRAEQGLWSAWTNPDHSHLVRHEIRHVLYADGPHMILGDGHFLTFEGARDVMPWLDTVRMASKPLVVDAEAREGKVHVTEVRCGSQVLATNLELLRVARLNATHAEPARGGADAAGVFRLVADLEAGPDADVAALDGAAVSLEGRIVDEDDRLVLRTAAGAGVILDVSAAGPLVGRFVDTVAGRGCRVRVDVKMREVFPWRDGEDGVLRAEHGLLGTADVYSASAQNHHVVGRRRITS